MTRENRRVYIGAAAYGLAALMVMGFAWLAIQNYQTTTAIRETQKSSRSLIEGIDTLTNKINSCVDPGGECFQKGQARTKEVVGNLGKTAAYASACADQSGVQGTQEVLDFVLQRLARDEASSTTSEE